MRHLVKPECRHGCRFLQITPALSICPHMAFGEASYLLGAEDEARRMLDRAGGYEAVLARVVAGEESRRQKRAQARDKRTRALKAMNL